MKDENLESQLGLVATTGLAGFVTKPASPFTIVTRTESSERVGSRVNCWEELKLLHRRLLWEFVYIRAE